MAADSSTQVTADSSRNRYGPHSNGPTVGGGIGDPHHLMYHYDVNTMKPLHSQVSRLCDFDSRVSVIKRNGNTAVVQCHRGDPYETELRTFETEQAASGRGIYVSFVPFDGLEERGLGENSNFTQAQVTGHTRCEVPFGYMMTEVCPPGGSPLLRGSQCLLPLREEDRATQQTLWLAVTPEDRRSMFRVLEDDGEAHLHNSPEAALLGCDQFYEDGTGPGEVGYIGDSDIVVRATDQQSN
jgi:hypothetical protein